MAITVFHLGIHTSFSHLVLRRESHIQVTLYLKGLELVFRHFVQLNLLAVVLAD